jgi:hypothetical protein
MRISKPGPYFITSDLNLSAVLVTSNFPLEKIDKENSKKVSFYFARSNKLQEIVDRYWRLELRIEPQDLFHNLKSLKNRIYSNE